jgi:hypothetical protein
MATKIWAEMNIFSTVTIEAQKYLVDNIFISAQLFVAIWHMATW